MFDFGELDDLFDESSFEEIPVDVETFCYDPDYLGLPLLSELQLEAIRKSTQIYPEFILRELFDDEEIIKQKLEDTNDEVLLVWGKGSGKDFISAVSCAYIVYQILCLKDPQKTYGKPPGDYIDIMNVAINADQANNVFFKGLKTRIKSCPWFEGKFEARGREVEFEEKNVRIISGHSQSEGLEGYNVMVVVLDEIDGFESETTGTQSKTTAEAIYEMHSASVVSRFGDQGKIIMLSFPRRKTGFVMNKYNEMVKEKESTVITKKLKLDPKLPDGIEGNELEVSWNEDRITRYAVNGMYAIRRPSWDVNPTKTIEMYTKVAFTDMVKFLTRFAAEPVDALEGFFKDHDKIDAAFRTRNGVNNDTGLFMDWMKPLKDTRYYVHVDLAKKQDRAAVAIAHVDKWVSMKIAGKIYSAQPYIIIDAVRWWTPRPNRDVDFKDVSDYIVALRQRGFDIGLVTFDRWRSDDMIQYLNSINLKAEVLSVAKPHYQDLSLVIHEERIEGPYEDLIVTELKELELTDKDKIEHPRKGSKDAADAIAGAVFNAIAYTPRNDSGEIEIYSVSNFDRKKDVEQEIENLIKAPANTKMPDEIEEWLARLV